MAPESPFTPEMRHRQARGQDPYKRTAIGTGSGSSSRSASTPGLQQQAQAQAPPHSNQQPSGTRLNSAYDPWAGGGSSVSVMRDSLDNLDYDSLAQIGSGRREGSLHQQESFEQRERRQMALSVLDSPELLMLVAESESDSIAGQRRRFTRMLCGYDDEDDAASSSKKTPKKKDRDQGSEAGGSSSSRFTRE